MLVKDLVYQKVAELVKKLTATGVTSECLKFLKSQTSEVILFYSGGKDSITLLDILIKNGFKVHCAFMYFVKDLDHINKYLNYARTKYGVEVAEFPHFMLSQYLNDNYYRFNSDKKVPNIKVGDIENLARKHFNCEWIVSGSKASDSMVRAFMMKQYLLNSISLNTKHAYPLSQWKKGDVLAYMKLNRLPMPITYEQKNKKSSGLELDGEILLYLQKNYPNDLKKILEVFPLAELLIKDLENGKEQNIEVSKIRGGNNKQK